MLSVEGRKLCLLGPGYCLRRSIHLEKRDYLGTSVVKRGTIPVPLENCSFIWILWCWSKEVVSLDLLEDSCSLSKWVRGISFLNYSEGSLEHAGAKWCIGNGQGHCAFIAWSRRHPQWPRWFWYNRIPLFVGNRGEQQKQNNSQFLKFSHFIWSSMYNSKFIHKWIELASFCLVAIAAVTVPFPTGNPGSWERLLVMSPGLVIC